MKQLFAGGMVLIGLLSTLYTTQVGALGLKVAPLEYKATLEQDERLQGFIDVSNPSGQLINVRTTVQGFRQIDNDGGLQFFDDERISAGIKPELPSFELGPREAVRMAFMIDGRVLPEGDVYAALFFTTEPQRPTAGVGQSVRVGTILSLVNKNPGSREAQLTSFRLPLVQLTDMMKGTYSIKNTGPDGTGFYPVVRLTSWPGGQSRQVESSLVFGGRERSNDVSFRLGYGIHRVEAAYGSSKQGQWVVLVAPWMLVTGLLVLLVIGMELLLLKKRRKKARKSPLKKTSSTSE